MTDFPVTIFHNPACGASRNVLALVRSAGYEPEVVEYLKRGWTSEGLRALLAQMGARPREVLRETGASAAELGLSDPSADDDVLIAAMVADPKLVNRPIVRTPKGAKLCRPAESVLDLLEPRPKGGQP